MTRLKLKGKKIKSYKVFSLLQCYIPKWALRHGNVASIPVEVWPVWQFFSLCSICWYLTRPSGFTCRYTADGLGYWMTVGVMFHLGTTWLSFSKFYPRAIFVGDKPRTWCYPQSVDEPPAFCLIFPTFSQREELRCAKFPDYNLRKYSTSATKTAVISNAKVMMTFCDGQFSVRTEYKAIWCYAIMLL